MQFGDILGLAGLRADGRRFEELRCLCYKLGSNLQATGSAYVEQVYQVSYYLLSALNKDILLYIGVE